MRDHQERGLRSCLRDEGADARHARNEPFVRQLAQRAIDGHARNTQRRNEVQFGGQTLAGLTRARLDDAKNMLLDLLVACSRRLTCSARTRSRVARALSRGGWRLAVG